jgi:hypothetical protein
MKKKDGPSPEEVHHLLRHRDVGVTMLAGRGVEIGALNWPQWLPRTCAVDYLDVADVPTLRGRFPELGGDSLVSPRWLGDVVRESIPAITRCRFNFVVMNHVLEHVVNPIQVISNVWQGIVDGGHLVLSIPDMRFTYDRGRSLTSFDHLLDEYVQGATSVAPDHFLELVGTTDPEALEEPYGFCAALEMARDRHEHAHVWDSESFRDFWWRTVHLLGLRAELLFESTGDANSFEYFAVIGRSDHADAREGDALRMLGGVWRRRLDLQQAFPVTQRPMAQGLLAWATTSGATHDSDAAALRPFQLHYHRLLKHSVADGEQLEVRLRTSLG